LELYAEVFEAQNALDKLEGFASFYGADFYRLPRNSGTIKLEKTSWKVPSNYSENGVSITPIKAGEQLNWKLQ
jgi:dihydroorotase